MMIMPPDVQFQLQAEQCYTAGQAFHGDLGLALSDYRIHVSSIVGKHVQSGTAGPGACCFLTSLCTTDLYLSAACTQSSERAWNRFTATYGSVIIGFARLACRHRDLAEEVAAGVLANMFFPDKSGRSRIASFDGRCPLTAWLRVTVNNQAAKERERKCNNLESAESLERMEDEAGILRLERSLRARTYGPLVSEALSRGVQSLTASERELILFRYDQELQVSQIAQVLNVSSACVTRRIQAIQRKLRDRVIATLSRKGLIPAAVEECTSEILENDAYSILALVKTAA
jgi:RNA polymerase sigma factor (sigma-70 family)